MLLLLLPQCGYLLRSYSNGLLHIYTHTEQAIKKKERVLSKFTMNVPAKDTLCTCEPLTNGGITIDVCLETCAPPRTKGGGMTVPEGLLDVT